MVRQRVHFTLGIDDCDDDPTPSISEYVELRSTIPVAEAPTETQSVPSNVPWCEENEVDEIWAKLLRDRELSCRNPKFNGWTTDEIIDSLLMDEYHQRWEAAREANEAQERVRIEEEDREEWEFPTTDELVVDWITSYPGHHVNDLGPTGVGYAESLVTSPIHTTTEERPGAGTGQGWNDEGDDWSDGGVEQVAIKPALGVGLRGGEDKAVGKIESERKEKSGSVRPKHWQGER